jgi:hypothetical protein
MIILLTFLEKKLPVELVAIPAIGKQLFLINKLKEKFPA